MLPLQDVQLYYESRHVSTVFTDVIMPRSPLRLQAQVWEKSRAGNVTTLKVLSLVFCYCSQGLCNGTFWEADFVMYDVSDRMRRVRDAVVTRLNENIRPYSMVTLLKAKANGSIHTAVKFICHLAATSECAHVPASATWSWTWRKAIEFFFSLTLLGTCIDSTFMHNEMEVWFATSLSDSQHD